MDTQITNPSSPPVSRWDLGRDRTPKLVLRPRVLLAEGDSDIRYLLRWAFRRDGCDVIESKSGEELLDYLSTSLMMRDVFPPPDLVVTDMDVPGLGDLEVLARIRHLMRRTPLIVLAGQLDGAGETSIRRLGIEHIVRKPFDLDHLRTIVRSVIAV